MAHPRLTNLIAPAAALAAALIATPVSADPRYDSCVAAGMTNADYRACGDALVKRREAELNRTWRERYAALEPRTKALLLAEQRAWIVWKDKSCTPWASGEYGTMGSAIQFYPCREQVIDARITYLVGLSEYDDGR